MPLKPYEPKPEGMSIHDFYQHIDTSGGSYEQEIKKCEAVIAALLAQLDNEKTQAAFLLLQKSAPDCIRQPPPPTLEVGDRVCWDIEWSGEGTVLDPEVMGRGFVQVKFDKPLPSEHNMADGA